MSSSEPRPPLPPQNQPYERGRKKLVPIVSATQLAAYRAGRFEVKHFRCGCHKQDCLFVWDLRFDKWVAIYEKDLLGRPIWDGNKLYDRQRHKRHDSNSYWRWKNAKWKGTSTDEMICAKLDK